MLTVLKPYLLTFIPIFVAVDALGNIPLFIGLTQNLSKKQKTQICNESVITATVLAVLFMFLGKLILRMLGITVADFQIAGGILLFVIANNLLLGKKQGGSVLSDGSKDVGIFPLGTPLLTGPAVLTITLMLLDNYGLMATFLSLLINMLIAWLCFRHSDIFTFLLGESGMRAFAKIMYILLAAIAVMMARKGVMGFFI